MNERSPRNKINPTNTIFVLWTFGVECSSFKEAEPFIASQYKIYAPADKHLSKGNQQRPYCE